MSRVEDMTKTWMLEIDMQASCHRKQKNSSSLIDSCEGFEFSCMHANIGRSAAPLAYRLAALLEAPLAARLAARLATRLAPYLVAWLSDRLAIYLTERSVFIDRETNKNRFSSNKDVEHISPRPVLGAGWRNCPLYCSLLVARRVENYLYRLELP